MLSGRAAPEEVVTDHAQALAQVVEEQLPAAFHNTEQYANNRVECDHGRLKARLRPMRGLKTDRTAQVIIMGHALVQNTRRGHYELGTEAAPELRLATAFDEFDHARLKARLRPMRGLKTERTAPAIIGGDVLIQTSAPATTNS